MKDWGISFEKEKSARIFYQILKEGKGYQDLEEKVGLHKRGELWSGDSEDEFKKKTNRLGNKSFYANEFLYYCFNL